MHTIAKTVGIQRVRYGGRPVANITVFLQFSVATGWVILRAEDDDGHTIDDLDQDEQATAIHQAAKGS
jgi:hypothetical protein